MGKPIEIPFLANVWNALRGFKNLEDGLDEVSGSLDDVARDAKRAGDDLGENITDGAREAERSTERLEKSFKDLRDEARTSSRQAGDDLGRNVRRGTDEAEDGIREFRDEANSTAREAAASFDGSAESIGDAFQEVAANAFAGFGPAGAAAGLAAALGIGLIIQALNEGGEQSDAFKQKVADLTQELIETGDGAPSLDYIVERLQELATTGDEAGVTLAKLRETADGSGRSYRDLAQAYAGNVDGLDDLIDATERALVAERERVQAEQDGIMQRGPAQQAQWDKTRSLERYIDYLKQAQTTAKEASEDELNYAQSGAAELNAKAERAETYAESITTALGDAGESWEEYYNAETGALDLAAYNAALEQRQAAMAAYQSNMQTLHGQISDDAYNYLVSLGANAAPLLQAYADAPNDQRERTAANWAALGDAASSEYTAKLKAGIPSEINGPTMRMFLDTDPYDNWIAGLPRQIQGPDVLMQTKVQGTVIP